MATREEFEKAANEVMALATRPSNEDLLQLYAFYKQATEGDTKGSRPGMFDLKARKKFDTWAEKKSMASEVAMAKYVELVKRLLNGT